MHRSTHEIEFEYVPVPSQKNHIVVGINGSTVENVFCPLSCRSIKTQDHMLAYIFSKKDPFQTNIGKGSFSKIN